MVVIGMTAFTDAKLKDGNHTVNTNASKVIWHGEKVTGEHFGTVDIKSGNLIVRDGELQGGSFEIDMTTITSTDLTGEYQQKLNGHLKSSDFFGVESYPIASFDITRVISKGSDGWYKIVGNITIKETTKEIKFDAQLSPMGDAIVAKADIVIDRSEFDVRYGSGSFFDNLGDKTIYDEFELKIELTTKS